ncbi:MAG: hypothetical protein JRC60_09415 [Deltaproteobacteria bacterium]|nr:hypothetical protein [Deltaproteobacteria bacterium]
MRVFVLDAFDATTINLCLETFPWAKFRAAKGAIKLHCQLDYDGNMKNFKFNKEKLKLCA